jgi:outer membrane protein
MIVHNALFFIQKSPLVSHYALRAIFLPFFILLPFTSPAQAVVVDSIVTIDLQEAIELGIKTSYKVKSANYAVEIGNENIKQQKKDRLPDLMFGSDVFLINDPTVFNESVFQEPEKIDYTPYQISGNLTISEVIFAGNRIKNSISQQVLQKKIAEYLAVKTLAEVKMIIINEYLRLYTLKKDYEINSQTIDQIELRLKTLRSRLLNGQVVKNDVSRSELQKSDFELKLLSTASYVSEANYFLTLLLGLPANTVIQVDTAYNYASDTLFVFDDILTTAFENRAEYQIAKTNIELSENTLKLVRGEYFPTVNGIGMYGLQNPIPGTFPPDAKFLSFLTVGVGINFNIATFYKSKPQQTAAELAIQVETENIQDLEIALSEEVRMTYTQYEIQRQSLALYLEKIRFAEENYKIVQSRYYNELALISDMVDAEVEYNQARLDLIKGQVQTRLNYYKMLKSIGRL